MTRFAHVADIHLTEQRGDSGESLDDQVERLVWIGEDASSEGAEAILMTGDVFEQTSTPAERNAAISVFGSWASNMPVVVAYGNHDAPGDLDFLSALRTDCNIHVLSRPGIVDLDQLECVEVACLPWPRKAHLVAKASSADDIDELAAKAMSTILMGFRSQWHEGVPRVLLGHAELGSAIADAGQPMTGRCDIELSCDDLLSTGADYIALGHIHKRQEFADGRVAYAGSPRQTTFGDADTAKGYLLVDVERDKPPKLEFRQAPGRQLITVEAEWIGTVLEDNGEEVRKVVNELSTAAGAIDKLGTLPNGSIIRLKYHVDEPDRQQAAEQAERAMQRWLDAGAYSVKLDPQVTPVYRVRSEAITEAKTNEEKLRAYWQSRGETPGRSEAILEKLGELEACHGS